MSQLQRLYFHKKGAFFIEYTENFLGGFLCKMHSNIILVATQSKALNHIFMRFKKKKQTQLFMLLKEAQVQAKAVL